jgi:hypothetical protein
MVVEHLPMPSCIKSTRSAHDTISLTVSVPGPITASTGCILRQQRRRAQL